MSALALPRPDNLRGSRFGTLVEHDLYMIAERIREIDPNLYIYDTEQPGKRYAICENCRDGKERLVFKTEAIDARILEHLRYLLHVPFEHRIDEAEKLATKREEERVAREQDELYERMGRPMWTQLDHDGFIPGGRGVSFPKRGVAGGKGSRAKS